MNMFNIILMVYAYIAGGLRTLSLSGGVKNVAAICLFIITGCVPIAVYVVLAVRKKKVSTDNMLFLVAALLWGGIYLMINPGIIIDSSMMVTADMMSDGVCAVIWSSIICYVVLRIVHCINAADDSQSVQIIRKMMTLIIVFTILVVAVISLPQLVLNIAGYSDDQAVDSTWAVVDFLFKLVNVILIIVVLVKGRRLCTSLIADEYSDESVQMADRLATSCTRVISAMVILSLVKNIIQLFTITTNSNLNFSVSIPVYELVILVVVYMSSKNLARSKAIKDENESYI